MPRRPRVQPVVRALLLLLILLPVGRRGGGGRRHCCRGRRGRREPLLLRVEGRHGGRGRGARVVVERGRDLVQGARLAAAALLFLRLPAVAREFI